MSRFAANPFRDHPPQWDDTITGVFADPDIPVVHQSLPEYHPTPLVTLPGLARRLGVKQILIKDEAHRFGLKAFKALGATYAIYRFINKELISRGAPPIPPSDFYRTTGIIPPDTITFSTATDGNHGRGVAWAARKLGQRAVIYMPANTVAARINNIKAEGAEVIVVDGTYDDAVATSAEQADKHGWQIISDTSWPGYTDIPRWIMAGYTTMFGEVQQQQPPDTKIDLVFVQAGVGALAAAAAWYYNREHYSSRPTLVTVEPTDADCLLESICSPDGNPRQSQGAQNSIMAGLNCGTPSPIAWPLIRAGFDMFIAVPDEFSVRAMRSFYFPEGNDPRIISGESGAAGLAALLALREDKSLNQARDHLHLSSDSTILLLNTEGDTDPVHFKKVVGS